MTVEKLDDLNRLMDEINNIEKALECFDTYEFVMVRGGYHDGDANTDFICSSDVLGFKGLPDVIRKFLTDRLEECEKKFEEG